MPLLPYVRREIFLQAIKNRDASALPDPNNREELFLKAIAEDVAMIPSGVSVILPAAVSEMLANLPEAHTHTELFYKEILDTILIATTITDTTPYISRETAGGLPVFGTAELNKKLGNTVCVNQLLPALDSKTQNGITGTRNADGSYTINGTATGAFETYKSFAMRAGHKYLFFGIPSGASDSTFYAYFFGARRFASNIFTIDNSGSTTYSIIVPNGATVNNVKWYPEIRDLTLWFGSDDRIPSDLLAHPENWGRYYAGSLAYAAGYLDSADGSVLKSKGADATTVLAEVDTGSEVLYGDGTEENSDVKLPSGEITRKRARIDLGTIANWVRYQESGGFYVFYSQGQLTQAKIASAMTSKYVYNSTNSHASLTADKSFTWFNTTDKSITIRDDSYSDVDTFKASLSGVYMEFTLATPTTEQGSLFDPTYEVEYGGTESWTNLKGIPQGHETEYKEYTT